MNEALIEQFFYTKYNFINSNKILVVICCEKSKI